jgi:hypothetical protein
MTGRKRSESEWLEIIAEQAGSGLTQKAWCGTNGINYYTFLDRAQRLRDKWSRDLEGGSGRTEANGGRVGVRKGAAPEGWAEVKTPYRPDASGKLTVTIGAFGVNVAEGFDEGTLKAVCRALREIC